MAESRIELSTEVTWEDLQRFEAWELARIGAPFANPRGRRVFFAGAAMCTASVLLIWALFRTGESLLVSAGVFAALWVVWAFAVMFGPESVRSPAWVKRRADPVTKHMAGAISFAFDISGVKRTQGRGTEFSHWRRVAEFATDGSNVYLCFGEFNAWVLPNVPANRVEQIRNMWDAGRQTATAAGATVQADIVSPPFSVDASTLGRVFRQRASSFTPKPGDFAATAIPTFVAYGMWPWTHSAAGVVVGPAGVLWVLWTFVGRHLYSRWTLTSAAHRVTKQVALEVDSIRLGFDPEGAYEWTTLNATFRPWSQVAQVDVSAQVTAVRDAMGNVYILPASAFPSHDEYFDFVERALEFRRAAISSAA